MQYVGFPVITSSGQSENSTNNQISANQIYGSANLGSSGFSLGGNGGFNGIQGIWLGASNFSQAPFSVDLQGNVIAKTLKVAGAILTGGAAADINANATTVNGAKITPASVTAMQMTTGTITAASGIINDINAGVISAGTLDASTVSVIHLSATNIDAGTLTGRTVQTASSGKRIVLNGPSDEIDIFDASGQVATMSGSAGQFIMNAPTGKTLNFIVNNGSGAQVFVEDTIAGMIAGSASVEVNSSSGVQISGTTSVTGSFVVTGTNLGFYSSGGISQPTVTGSRAANAALGSLLTALASMGLIINSSS